VAAGRKVVARRQERRDCHAGGARRAPGAMSRRAWATLGASCAFTACTVVYVHWAQENDRVTMHRNVVLDIEREQAEKALLQATGASPQDAPAECESGICDLKSSRMKG